MSTTTTPAPVTAKVTKAAVISALTVLLGLVTYFASTNPAYAFDGALVGYVIGDTLTFLQGSTLSDKWTYATKAILLTGVLTVVGTFVAQLVSANAISPYIGGLIGYAIGEAVMLLSVPPSGTVPMAPPAPTPASPAAPATIYAPTAQLSQHD